jgi:hypothetical protein
MPAVRVLVAIDPFMYGQALAFSLRKERPRAEVSLLSSSEDLAAELERARPHLVVANRVPAAAKARSFWVEVWVEVDALRGLTSLDAEITADGYSGSVVDVRVDHVLAALDRAKELLAGGESAGEETVGGTS